MRKPKSNNPFNLIQRVKKNAQLQIDYCLTHKEEYLKAKSEIKHILRQQSIHYKKIQECLSDLSLIKYDLDPQQRNEIMSLEALKSPKKVRLLKDESENQLVDFKESNK
jgi:hypothetical protein